MTMFTKEFMFVCNECHERIDILTDNLYLDNLKTANKILKEKGWQIVYDAPNYKHFCPKCIYATVKRPKPKVKMRRTEYGYLLPADHPRFNEETD